MSLEVLIGNHQIYTRIIAVTLTRPAFKKLGSCYVSDYGTMILVYGSYTMDR